MTKITDITFAERDADDPAPIRGSLSVDHDGVSYVVRTESRQRLHSAAWRHEVTRWCLGEDDAGTSRPLDELPDEVATEVDDALGRYVR